jgi:hypothetical protein
MKLHVKVSEGVEYVRKTKEKPSVSWVGKVPTLEELKQFVQVAEKY